MAALFPGYVGELASGGDDQRSIDDAIERRESCRLEPIRRYLTTDHVSVDDDYSDTQLAEIFLHHRVLVVPIATPDASTRSSPATTSSSSRAGFANVVENPSTRQPGMTGETLAWSHGTGEPPFRRRTVRPTVRRTPDFGAN